MYVYFVGIYINGIRVIDRDVYYRDRWITNIGDITIATHPFFVPRP